ncbi:3-oxoacyl-[acyl-carrier-protein] reductase [Teratosphaeria destructans]|uniref:3-oxoacyl-[acyl-carrier-protein] reductase n=1 Tax=Teratosphaeria destructans TaxID=418781 RepID=A0A9W7T0D6_9PEZI|nr:3-oxoacyl-[acyl-carrier-protein] reductase [Teratosphaeria destructans]
MDGKDSRKMFSVEGMVICITGGGTGIGKMMTEAFATHGAAKVYIVGRRKEKLDETAKLSPDVIVPVVGDVTSKDSLLDIATQIKHDAGFVNLLCVNSGTMPPSIGLNAHEVPLREFQQKALEQTPEDWAQAFVTNASAIFFTSMAFLGLLDAGNSRGNAAGRQSQILVTSSIASFLRNPATLGVYGASKAAATHLVKHMASTLVPYSIRVNALAPGLFPSELAGPLIEKAVAEGRKPEEEGAVSKRNIPAERLGCYRDMAGTVLYLASAAGAYVNGNVQVVDGGRLCNLPATY